MQALKRKEMIIMNNEKDFRLIAPDIDSLLRFFRDGHTNATSPTPAVIAAINPVFDALRNLAPSKRNDEYKSIWLQIPRGTIDDYYSYEDMLANVSVESREQYEAFWQEDYPDELKWYKLELIESRNREGDIRFRAVFLDHKCVVSITFERNGDPFPIYTEEAVVTLCSLIMEAIPASMEKLKQGTYNDDVNAHLPYWFRTGVIRRSVIWKKAPDDWKKDGMDGLSPETASEFKRLQESGINDVQKIGRIKSFTANDFFHACELGYKALGYDCDGLTPDKLYLKYADGRDEGLTGTGYGLNAGPGIDFDDPAAWDQWYFSSRGGGHPWEVVPGGNSTHMDLFVSNDVELLGYQFRLGEISQQEYDERLAKAGYYFHIRGKHRPLESVTFYTTLSAAGLPVVIDDAKEILARFDGSDYVGIVPHHVALKYCESMFPVKYGPVIDFTHVYADDIAALGEDIEWLPEAEARLIQDSE